MKNGNHTHICRFCDDEFGCAAVTHCSLDDRTAVCYKQACQDMANSCAVDDD